MLLLLLLQESKQSQGQYRNHCSAHMELPCMPKELSSRDSLPGYSAHLKRTALSPMWQGCIHMEKADWAMSQLRVLHQTTGPLKPVPETMLPSKKAG